MMLAGAKNFVDRLNDGYYLEHYLGPLYRRFAMFSFAVLMFAFAVATGVEFYARATDLFSLLVFLATVPLPFLLALAARKQIHKLLNAYSGKDRAQVATKLNNFGWMAIGFAYGTLGFVISDIHMMLGH